MKKTLNILTVILALTFSVFFFFYLFVKLNFPVLYKEEFKKASEKTGVDICYLYAIAKTESGFSPEKVSSVGAVGIMQIMPETAKFICEKNSIDFDENRLFDAEYNILLGASYFRYLLDKFQIPKTAIAAYNAGEGNVMLWLKNESFSSDGKNLKEIPFKETKNYTQKVISAYASYKKIKG